MDKLSIDIDLEINKLLNKYLSCEKSLDRQICIQEFRIVREQYILNKLRQYKKNLKVGAVELVNEIGPYKELYKI